MNLYAMLADAVRRHGTRIALACGETRIDYRGLDAAVRALGARLRGLGAGRGDRVLIFLDNSIDYPIVLLGAIRAGMVAVPVNAKLHPRELAFIAGDCEPAAIVTEEARFDALRRHLPAKAASRLVSCEEIMRSSGDPDTRPPAETAPDDPAWIFYTSGTTGRPKGATLTHRNLIAMTVNCLADLYPFAATDRALHVAPLSHGSGLYMLPALVRGAENVVSHLKGFQPDQVLEMVARHRITVLPFLAPTMIVRLLDAAPRDDIDCLRGALYGGAPIHLEHLRAALERFGPIFTQLYGQGEAPMTISYLPAPDHLSTDEETLLSAGYVRSGVEVAIVGEDGSTLAAGEVGEIAVRGDVVMKGYWRNAEATAAALRGGWLRTGDIGRLDALGRLRVLDRRHDTIISGGSNVYPKEVEDVIAGHPAVREVIAFGLPDREWGEIVAAAIVADREIGEAELLDFCRDHLAAFKKPKRLFFVEELPKNAYGKVLRRDLKLRFAAP